MEKSLKFNAKELFDGFMREFNQDEMNELYKALIAYDAGFSEYDDEVDKKMEEVMNFYWDTDDVRGIVNDMLNDEAQGKLFDNI